MFQRYKSEIHKDGTAIIRNVPIFAETERTVVFEDGKSKLVEYTSDVLEAFVEEANRRQSQNEHLPTLFADEHDSLGTVRRVVAGFLSNQKIVYTMLDGVEKSVVFADLCITVPRIFNAIDDSQFPGISVEIPKEGAKTIASASLLNRKPPAMKFRPILIEKPEVVFQDFDESMVYSFMEISEGTSNFEMTEAEKLSRSIKRDTSVPKSGDEAKKVKDMVRKEVERVVTNSDEEKQMTPLLDEAKKKNDENMETPSDEEKKGTSSFMEMFMAMPDDEKKACYEELSAFMSKDKEEDGDDSKKDNGIDNSPVGFSEKEKADNIVFGELMSKIESLEGKLSKMQKKELISSEINSALDGVPNKDSIAKKIMVEFEESGYESAKKILEGVSEVFPSGNLPPKLTEDFSQPRAQHSEEVLKYKGNKEHYASAIEFAESYDRSTNKNGMTREEYVDFGMQGTYKELR